jgi:hypothetical protein
MRVMTEAMPNLQQITIDGLGYGHRWSDGEDPDEELAVYDEDRTAHDIEIISNFSKLCTLKIEYSSLNGRYPVLFNFPLLLKLSIKYCNDLKWDLEMLGGFPLLKELDCLCNRRMTGNINSLRVLKETLELVKIRDCSRVEGNFMDLAEFPHLKVLDMFHTAVTGDIRDICENDFSSMEQLILPDGVYGGNDHQLQRISDAPDLMRAVYILKKQRPALSMSNGNKDWSAVLSCDSPDWYYSADDADTPPFRIRIVQVGSRIGYRWVTLLGKPCEINWLDPEPDRESSDYEKYTEILQYFEFELRVYRGFYEPPTEEEYDRLMEEFADDEGLESDSESSEGYFSFASHIAEEDEEFDDESEEDEE